MHLVPPWSLSASPIVIGGSGILRTLSVQLSMSFLSLYCFRSEIHSNSQFHFFVRLCSAELFYYGKSFASSFNTYDNFATNVEKIFNQLRNDQTFSDIKLWQHCIYQVRRVLCSGLMPIPMERPRLHSKETTAP